MSSTYSRTNGILKRKLINDFRKELVRKFIHICAAFVPIFLHYYYDFTIFALSTISILYIFAESFRIKGIRLPVFSDVIESASRKRDENKFVLGPITLAGGILCAAVFFDETAAAVGIYALAFGDGIASLAGKLFGKIRIPFTRGKTVAGSLACFIAVFVSSFIVLKNIEYALLIAFCAMCIEMLPLKDFDNIFIPVLLAALVQYLL